MTSSTWSISKAGSFLQGHLADRAAAEAGTAFLCVVTVGGLGSDRIVDDEIPVISESKKRDRPHKETEAQQKSKKPLSKQKNTSFRSDHSTAGEGVQEEKGGDHGNEKRDRC